jgi:SpoVK/Ycf46/Vps4 family AAA+-type ATPase
MSANLPAFLLPPPSPGATRPDLGSAYDPLLARWVIDLAFLLGWTDATRGRRGLWEDDEFAALIQLPESEEEDSAAGDDERPAPLQGLTKAQWIECLRRQRVLLAAMPLDPHAPLFRNLPLLARLLGLSEAEQAVLALAVFLGVDGRLKRVIARQNVKLADDALARVLGALFGLPPAAMGAALSSQSLLVRTGLIEYRGPIAADLEDRFEASRRACNALLQALDGPEAMTRLFVRRAPDPTLRIEDFPHLRADAQACRALLHKALAGAMPGTNVLLEGRPGTGKTEFAGALAASLGAELFVVDFADHDGDPMRGEARLGAFDLAQRLLAPHANAILLFDEAEDVFEADGFGRLFASSSRATGGKAWVNRILESNPVPTLWISNDADSMDRAYLRRFDLSVRFAAPPRTVRLAIARRHLGGWADGPDDSLLAAIADNERLTPAQLQKAARLARCQAGSDPEQGRALVLHALSCSARLLGQGPLVRERPAGSFCLYGLPGTGKSAFARHVAQVLDRPALVRRASDLLDKWWGGTESNLAAMFEEARSQEAVLILDEADSFLRERSRVQHSWEAMEVNELLTQMESFPGIFFCTTNLLDALDAASLRRFDWKIRFDALRPRQAWALVVQEFARLDGDLDELEPWRAEVMRLRLVTPGDVAVVVRQYALLGRAPSAEDFVGRLAAELAAKRGAAAVSQPRHANYASREESAV